MPAGWLLRDLRQASPSWLPRYFRECEEELAACAEFRARLAKTGGAPPEA